MSPAKLRWRFHPDNFTAAWEAAPGRAFYDIITARQRPHATNPDENWGSEPVWLLRLKHQKHSTAWWIGFYDPVQVCRMLFTPELRFNTMEKLLDELVNRGVRLCTPARATYYSWGQPGVQRAMDWAVSERSRRQQYKPEVRPSDWVYTDRDWNVYRANLPQILSDRSLARVCALAGGWLNRAVLREIDPADVTNGPTSAAMKGPVGKVFYSSEDQILLDDAAEREQIALVIGTFVDPLPGVDSRNWPRKSFMPPPSTTHKVFVLPQWTDADERRLARAVSAPPEPLQQPRSRQQWELHFKENIDRGRAKWVAATRKVCRLFLDEVVGPVPAE